MSAGDAPAATAVERLSVATAIIGLLAVGGKIMEKIWDLNLPSTKHTPALTQALHQVKQCRSTVHILYKTFCRLEAARLPFPERAAWIAVDDLIATLADTVLAFSDLQIICDALERQRLEPSGAAASAPGYDDRLGALCSRMRWQSLSMTIMMTILKCPGAADAEYARVGLERRMTRILTSNTALAQRMRLLEGAVDSRASEAAGGPPRVRIPFICAANERRPGGDWETGCAGYEEKLCRRSNLSATLSSPWPGVAAASASHYPIPSTGGILSDSVVVCRGPHDRYEKLERWFDLPVVSVPPTRWPKLKDNGSRYSFAEERDMMREKMRGALRICLYNNYDRVVIGDFGLGNSCRNPPQEVAEIWRDVFLFDPDLRGQFAYVIFAFEDPAQSTTRLILDEIAKKDKKGGAAKGRSSRDGAAASPSSAPSRTYAPTDLSVFQCVFDAGEIQKVLSAPDPRYGLDMITS
ncbi:hypothetical protein CDD83_1487 [Cordyceps sp. RAO-2017]|nr:hypothetical protein CDD83_1487 [Cordyceps sp. RAO-2017]